ncbi:MAG: flagellar FliJ family protein [Treponema sp.]|nr:MAG: flagellar FliJ family protein [Treponema sp.]
MTKFKFELQDILEAKKFEQTQAENELGKALAAEKEIQDKLDLLAEQKKSMQQSVKNTKDFNQIMAANNFSDFVRNQSEYLFREMAEAKIVTEQKREVLKKIMQSVDSLERLRDFQKEDFKAAQKRKQMKIIGGIVSAKYAREHSKDNDD